MKRRRKKEALVSPKLRSKMSKKLNETQLIAAHLLGAGHKPKDIAKKLDVREETISRWKSNDAFYDVMRTANFEIYANVLYRQKSLIALAQDTLEEALKSTDIDTYRKCLLALKFFQIVKDKELKKGEGYL